MKDWAVADSDFKKLVVAKLRKGKSRKFGLKSNFNPAQKYFESGHPDNINGLFSTEKADFLTENAPWHIDVAVSSDKISRKVFKSRHGFIYRKARLIHPVDYNLKDDWYIIYYTTDHFNEKLIRKRLYKKELKQIDSAKLRIKFADEVIREINELLHDDYHTETIQQAPPVLKFDYRAFTVAQAIEYVGHMKVDIEGVKPKTFKEYISTKTTVEDFHMHEKLPQTFLLRNVNDVYVRKYFDYLKQVRKTANKTYNARRTIMHSVFAALLKRDPKLFGGVNLIASIKFLKTASKKHTAYTDEQIQAIQKAIVKGKEDHLLLFIKIMYYTLSRPEELRNLRVGDVQFVDRKILFRSEISKTTIEQHVGINESLAKVIEESGILKFDPMYYIFSNDDGLHQPGEHRVSINYFYKRIKPYITKLGFYKTNPNYTLYSFKHTGAIALYKATKDIKLVQSQCRHQSIEQTNIYLRDLGAVDDFVQLNKWVSPF